MMSAAAPHAHAPVLLFDRSSRLRLQFSGPKAAESLTGLVTNDVLALRGGEGLYACALTPKGRVIADVRILGIAGADGTVESFVADANATAGVGFFAMIRKYVNPRLAKYIDVSASTSCLTLVGAGATEVLRQCGADSAVVDALIAAPPFTHRVVALGDIGVRLVRVPDLGLDVVFDLHVDHAAADALRAALRAAGAEPANDIEWQRRRVIAGRPEWGLDMDESTLAQEANMDALQAISYKKGCYTGQETVSRVHFRGHVNRTLRRVTYADDAAPAVGTPLSAPDSNAVGDARSTVIDNDGSRVGIAMLRREVTDGATLSWVDADGSAHALTVVGAPDEG